MRGAKNAVFVEAEAAGDLMFYGAGAGGRETASAVLGDLVSAARRHVIGGPGIAESRHANLPILSMANITTRYQIALAVADQPGVLAVIANTFSDHGVSVETLVQSAGVDPHSGTATATLVIGTHEASESSLAATVKALAATSVIESVVSVLRVEGL